MRVLYKVWNAIKHSHQHWNCLLFIVQPHQLVGCRAEVQASYQKINSLRCFIVKNGVWYLMTQQGYAIKYLMQKMKAYMNWRLLTYTQPKFGCWEVWRYVMPFTGNKLYATFNPAAKPREEELFYQLIYSILSLMDYADYIYLETKPFSLGQ